MFGRVVGLLRHLKDPVVLIFFAIAILVELLAFGLWWRQKVVESWPRVEVTILKKEVTATAGSQYGGSVTVATQSDQQFLVMTDWGSTDPVLLEKELASYKEGSKASLPQNPENKDELRLPPDPTQAWLPFLLAATGSLFALVPIGVVALSNRKDAVSVGGLVFVLAGGMIVLLGLYQTATKTKVLTQWIAAEATVLESRVGHRPGRRHPRYGLDAQMEYQVAGAPVKALLGSRSGWPNPTVPEGLIASEFAPGTTHQIRYNPANSNIATFEAEWSLRYFWEGVLSIGLGMCMAGLGWAMARFLKPAG